MTENFLSYIWSKRLFNLDNLKSTSNTDIDIIHPGYRNCLSGPDFSNAKIKIDKVLWVGNVEIHINEEDWYLHRHHEDRAYNNVILHVVYSSGRRAVEIEGQKVQTIALKGRIPFRLINSFDSLVHSQERIPCSSYLKEFSSFHVNNLLDRMVIERLEVKINYLTAYWIKSKKSWEELSYYALLKSYGFKHNSDPFEQVAFSTPYRLIQKYKSSRFSLEALLFGQAGLLEVEGDSYQNDLLDRYAFLKHKYKIQSINRSCWKFGGVRPGNTPYLRIAQLVVLLTSIPNLFSTLILEFEYEKLKKIFQRPMSEYWITHSSFGKLRKGRIEKMGNQSFDSLVLNWIVPILFFYGIETDDQYKKDKALKILENLNPEYNSVVKQWSQLNFKLISSYQTQALLHLTNDYCFKKKCLNCSLGKLVLNKTEIHDR